MANRSDLLSEVDTTIDANGDYIGPWIDSGQVQTVRVIYTDLGIAPAIEESADQANVIRGIGLTNGANVNITARYFRLKVDGSSGYAGQAFRAVIRVAE